MAGKSHKAKMLEALSDGLRWSTHELVQYGVGYAAHSRASDLRSAGYSVKSTRQRSVPGESDVYFYELQGVPAIAPAFEASIDPPAATRLQAMRAARGTPAPSPVGQEAGSGSAPGQGEPEQAIGAPLPSSLPPPAAADPSVAAGTPSRTQLPDLPEQLGLFGRTRRAA